MYAQQSLAQDRQRERLSQAREARSVRQLTELRKLEKRQERAERALLNAWQRVEHLHSRLRTVS